MEALGFESQWERLSEVLKQDIELNREALRRLLQNKANRQFGWIKFESLRKTIGSTIVVILFLTRINLSTTWTGTLGLIMLFLFLAWVWVREIRMMILLSRIDYKQAVIETRRQMLQIKKIKLKEFRLDILLTPVSLLVLALLIDLDISKFEDLRISGGEIGLILITVGIFIVSVITYFMISIRRRFKKLNKAFEELETLEK